MRNRHRNSIEPYRVPDPSTKINAKWSNEELLLGVQGKVRGVLSIADQKSIKI